eukprot:m.6241 g.6241  ORF g.6241 m.6241 type:complete len:415 (+) comp3505_c0_seq1:226-1470(+)
MRFCRRVFVVVVLLQLSSQSVSLAKDSASATNNRQLPTIISEDSNLPKHIVTGFSAGASAAVNHFVAFSKSVYGLGIIGGSPYGCNILPDAGNTCSGFASQGHKPNNSIPWPDFLKLCSTYMKNRAAKGEIDSLSNIVNKPVFLFSGTDDVWVYQNVMKATALQFQGLKANVHTEFTLPAAHSWVVDNTTCSVPLLKRKGACCGFKDPTTKCSNKLPPTPPDTFPDGCCGACYSGDYVTAGWRPPINNCNFDLSGEILKWVFGSSKIKPRDKSHVSENYLYNIPQAPFVPNNSTTKKAQLDDIGFIYIPPKCLAPSNKTLPYPKYHSTCGVHIHYHPCGGSWRDVSTGYMMQNALPAYATANNFVIIYPQSVSIGNPEGDGCFDWSGSTSDIFDTKSGAQIGTAINMMMMMREN